MAQYTNPETGQITDLTGQVDTPCLDLLKTDCGVAEILAEQIAMAVHVNTNTSELPDSSTDVIIPIDTSTSTKVVIEETEVEVRPDPDSLSPPAQQSAVVVKTDLKTGTQTAEKVVADKDQPVVKVKVPAGKTKPVTGDQPQAGQPTSTLSPGLIAVLAVGAYFLFMR